MANQEINGRGQFDIVLVLLLMYFGFLLHKLHFVCLVVRTMITPLIRHCRCLLMSMVIFVNYTSGEKTIIFTFAVIFHTCNYPKSSQIQNYPSIGELALQLSRDRLRTCSGIKSTRCAICWCVCVRSANFTYNTNTWN